MKPDKDAKMAWLMSGLFGVLASVFLIFGYQLESADAINLSDKNALSILLMFILIFTIDTRYVWRNYDSALTVASSLALSPFPRAQVMQRYQEETFLSITCP